MRYAAMTTAENIALALAWAAAGVVGVLASAGAAVVGAVVAGVLLRLTGVVG